MVSSMSCSTVRVCDVGVSCMVQASVIVRTITGISVPTARMLVMTTVGATGGLAPTWETLVRTTVAIRKR